MFTDQSDVSLSVAFFCFSKINLVVSRNLFYICLMATKEITPRQYAKLKGCTLQNVTKMIREKKKLDYVSEIKTFGRFYVLVVIENLSRKHFK